MGKRPVETKADDDFSPRLVVIMLVVFLLVSLISLLVFLQVLERVKEEGASSLRASFDEEVLASSGPSDGKVMLEIREPPQEVPDFEVKEG